MFHVEQKLFRLNKIDKDRKTGIPGNTLLRCKDHLVSNEIFQVQACEDGILKTQPVPQDLGKYYESKDYISHSDSAHSFQDKIYQIVKSYMLDQKANWIKQYFDKGRLLDYGAGTGDFMNQMKKHQWEVAGIEPNKNARALGSKKGLEIYSEISGLKNTSFDVISLWHVLEHIPDFEIKISEFRNLLNENGVLIIAVPNYNSYDSNYYKENWAAWDVPRHLWHFSRTGIKRKIESKGFKLLNEKPLKFDSYYVSLLSEKNKPERTNILNAVFRGFLSNNKAKTSGEYSSVAYFFKKVPKNDFKPF